MKKKLYLAMAIGVGMAFSTPANAGVDGSATQSGGGFVATGGFLNGATGGFVQGSEARFSARGNNATGTAMVGSSSWVGTNVVAIPWGTTSFASGGTGNGASALASPLGGTSVCGFGSLTTGTNAIMLTPDGVAGGSTNTIGSFGYSVGSRRATGVFGEGSSTGYGSTTVTGGHGYIDVSTIAETRSSVNTGSIVPPPPPPPPVPPPVVLPPPPPLP